MRPLGPLLCALAVLASGCAGESGGTGEEPLAQLTIVVDRDGSRGSREPREVTIRCSSGEQSDICAAAARLAPEDFAPVPGDRACTELFGGPQTARISGQLNGRAVQGEFARTNGCEIKRWDRVADLLERVP